MGSAMTKETCPRPCSWGSVDLDMKQMNAILERVVLSAKQGVVVRPKRVRAWKGSRVTPHNWRQLEGNLEEEFALSREYWVIPHNWRQLEGNLEEEFALSRAYWKGKT